ncbi:F-box protein CPR1-like protein [Tanacetum coccineum]
MAERIPNEIYEEILVRLDVENLLRCKSVCKSWKSLISHPRFIEAHWKRRCNNNDNGHAIFPIYTRRKALKYYIVGSARGLVCINSFSGDEIIVANPWTREEKIFKMPHVTEFSCWGFGYDSLTDDYKVVLGIEDNEMDQTSFQVLSLKSNVWKNIGHVNYRCSKPQRLGTFCNEALHWVMHPLNEPTKSLIISLYLSKEHAFIAIIFLSDQVLTYGLMVMNYEITTLI